MDNDGRADSDFCKKRLFPDHIYMLAAQAAYRFCRAEKANLHQPICPSFIVNFQLSIVNWFQLSIVN